MDELDDIEIKNLTYWINHYQAKSLLLFLYSFYDQTKENSKSILKVRKFKNS
jgi:hypothetical protein